MACRGGFCRGFAGALPGGFCRGDFAGRILPGLCRGDSAGGASAGRILPGLCRGAAASAFLWSLWGRFLGSRLFRPLESLGEILAALEMGGSRLGRRFLWKQASRSALREKSPNLAWSRGFASKPPPRQAEGVRENCRPRRPKSDSSGCSCFVWV